MRVMWTPINKGTWSSGKTEGAFGDEVKDELVQEGTELVEEGFFSRDLTKSRAKRIVNK